MPRSELPSRGKEGKLLSTGPRTGCPACVSTPSRSDIVLARLAGLFRPRGLLRSTGRLRLPGGRRYPAPRQDFRLLPLALASLLGSSVGLHLSVGFWHTTALLLLVVIAMLSLAARCGPNERRLAKRSGGEARSGWFHALLICLGFLGALGAASLHGAIAHPERVTQLAEVGATIELSGQVDSRIEYRPTPWGEPSCQGDVRVFELDRRVPVSAHAIAPDTARKVTPPRGGTMMTVHGLPCEALEGQRVWLKGKLAASDAGEQVAARVYARVTRLSGPGDRGARVVRDIDRHLSALLTDRPAHVQGLLPGVALGDDSRVSAELAAAMRLTQLTHLIAVSGGHVSILTVIVVAVVGRRWRVLSATLCLFTVYGLVLLVGPQASVLRAVAMSLVVLAALGWGRTTQAIAALSLAVICVCLVDPWLATSYGFLLSASATAGIVIAGTPLAEHLAGSMPSSLAQAVAVPLAAQISCTPILMLFSDAGSIWGVCANALVAPVVAPLTVSGLAAALASPVLPSVASWLLVPAQMATWWIDLIARALASWPGSGIPLIWAGAFCLLMLVLLLCVRSPIRAVVVLLLAAGLAWWIVRSHDVPMVRPDWVIVQCDVGQGSALVARSAATSIMIDVGPPGSAAADCLRQAGIEHLNVLVLSHSHTDHVGGLPEVLDAVGVDHIWMSPNPDPIANTQWVHSQLRTRELEWSNVLAGQSLWSDGTQSHEDTPRMDGNELARVLWPRTENTRVGEANAQSIALYLNVAGGVLVLSDLTGDSQDRLVHDPKVADMMANANTVVVAHHGSADQSSRLAERVTPRIALISVGENSYGHPSSRALELYGDSLIYDTARCGPISLGPRGEMTSGCEGSDVAAAK